ncbi:MAG: NAD(+)/NADH kinase [Kosmotogaceae bacterium]
MKVAIFFNHNRIDDIEQKNIINEIEKHEIKTCVFDQYCVNDLAGIDLVMTFGGDGTVLRAVNAAYKSGIPILSFKVGSVGFLASFELEDLNKALQLLLKKKLIVDKRKLLKIETEKSIFMALNDCVLERGSPSRTVEFEVRIADYSPYLIVGDGVVISTSTGSTAYNLAAGGALTDPKSDVYQITPLSAHNPYVGPIVLAAYREVHITVKEDKNAPVRIYIDGYEAGTLEKGKQITTKLSDKVISLLREKEFDFVSVMKEKLAFGGRSRNDL